MKTAAKPSPIAASISSKDDDPFGADQLLYRFLVDSLTEYAVFVVSPDGDVISWNAGAESIFGYTQAESIGRSFGILFTAADVAAGEPQRALASVLSSDRTQHDRWYVRKNGTRFWGTNTVQPLHNAAGKLLGFTKLVHDSTDSHLALQELSDSEQQLRLLIESVKEYAIFSIAPDGTIKTWNAGAEKIFGYTQAESIGRNFDILYGADDVTAGVPVGELRKATTHGFTNVERWLVRKDGTYFLASGKLSELERDADGKLRGFVKIAHDITQNHAAAQVLRHQAQYDELTDLSNRRTFFEHIQRAIASMKRRSSNLFAVLFIDVDHFKAVNDEYGHLVADQLLAVTARRLESCVRAVDIVARIGGDEFAVLLNGISGIVDANEAAGRIGIEMRQPVRIDDLELRTTASIGIAIGTETYVRPEDILRDADTAMYAAKTQGRARSVVFSASMLTDGGVSFDFAAEIRHAIEHGELRIAYQPILRLRDTTIVGVEALVRWQHPQRGLLQPAQFIPKAEESDLIVAIDRWMIRKACQQLADWQVRGGSPELQMSVNVSSKQFSHDDFLGDVQQSLGLSGLAARRLRLEITESAILERGERADALRAAIRRLGIRLDVDDFGTGYSSLGTLQHMCVDALKIDSSFVAWMSSLNGAKLIETVMLVAQKFDIVVIAEGIETTEQASRLIALGCEFGQGFLFAPPLDADAAGRFQAVSR